MSKTEAEKLEWRERLAAQKEARAVLTTNRRGERERKLDTRRKVILGSLLVDAAQTDPRWRPLLDQLMARVNRQQDLKVFEGWAVDTGAGPPTAKAAADLPTTGPTIAFPEANPTRHPSRAEHESHGT